MPRPGVTGFVTGRGRDFRVLVVFADSQIHLLALAVALHVQLDLRARRLFADDHLEIAAGLNRLAVDSW